MQSITFLVKENHGKIPSYNVAQSNNQMVEIQPVDDRGQNIDALFPSAHGKTIIHLDQIQDYPENATKGLTPADAQFPKLPPPPGSPVVRFFNPTEVRVDLSVYEINTDEYTNQLVGYSGQSK